MADRQLFISPDYIEGLYGGWVNNTTVKLSAGAAFVPGYEGLVYISAEVQKAVNTSGMPASLTANTWYYMYLYHVANGAGSFVLTTDPPASPYWGTARVRSVAGVPDENYRLVYAFRTDGTPRFYNTHHGIDGMVLLREQIDAAPWYVLPGTGSPSREIAVGHTATPSDTTPRRLVPINSRSFALHGLSTSAFSVSGTDWASYPTGGATFQGASWGRAIVPVASDQVVRYNFSAGTNYLTIAGYDFPR